MVMSMSMVFVGLSAIAYDFDVTLRAASWVVIAQALTISALMLPMGRMADIIGRKRVHLIGLSLFILGSVLTLAAATIETLALGRALQAIGGCAGMALARAAIRDVYDRERSAAMIGYVTMAMVTAPMLAAPLGGWLFQTYGLDSVLLIPLVGGVATLALCAVGLRETLAVRSQKPVRLGQIVLANARILKLASFRDYAMTGAFSATAYFTFVACSPFVSERLMGVSPAGYGQWFLALSIAYMFANGFAGRFSGRIGGDRVIWMGLIFAQIGLAAIAWLAYDDALAPASLFLLMCFVSIGNGLTTPNAIAGAISADPTQAGAASGMTGFLQMTLGALAGLVCGFFLDAYEDPFVLAAAMLIASTVAIYRFATARSVWQPSSVSSHSQ